VPRKGHKRTTPPRFKLSRVGSAIEDAEHVPVVLRAKLTAILQRLARQGCRAADYALSGTPPWPHICAAHFDGWRVVLAFPADDEVAILKIAPHDSSADPYRELAEDLGIAVSTEPRRKPACCDPDGEPPVDPDLVASVRDAFAAFSRRERHARSRR